MAQRPVTPATPVAPVLQPLTAITVLPATEQKKIQNKVLREIAQNMGIGVGAIPADVKKVVTEQVKESLNNNIRSLTHEFVNREVKGKLTQSLDVMSTMDNRLKGALKGITHVSASQDVGKIMTENAKLLRKKFDALVQEGFSNEQAFEILIADLSKPRR